MGAPLSTQATGYLSAGNNDDPFRANISGIFGIANYTTTAYLRVTPPTWSDQPCYI
jgi:hypothetical protein